MCGELSVHIVERYYCCARVGLRYILHVRTLIVTVSYSRAARNDVLGVCGYLSTTTILLL